MPVVYNTTTINDRLQAVIDNIDAGGSGGVLRIGTTGMVTRLASITLQNPCGTAGGGVLSFSGLPLVGPITENSGEAALATIEDSAGNIVVSGLTVGLSSASDIVMSTTTISSNQAIALIYATITGT